MKAPEVALHGFVYSANFGDMLLSRLTMNVVRRQLPRADLCVPFASRSFLKSSGIPSETGIGRFLSADALLYHGGGYFAFPSSFQLLNRARLYKRFYAPGLAAASLGKPYGIFGVGVGPIHSKIQKCAVRRVFQGAGMVTVRDEEGYDWLRRIGVRDDSIHQAADLAINLEWRDVPQESIEHADALLASIPGDRRIGIHLSAPSDASADYEAVMRGVVTYAHQHPEFGIVVLCDHLPPQSPETTPQYKAGTELAKRIGSRAQFIGQPPLWTLVAVLGKLDGLLTNKLHAGIVSSAFGKHVVSIAKNPKNFRFFRQIDASSRCISLDDAKTTDIPAFLEAGFETIHHPRPIPARIRALAHKNETLIGSFLRRHCKASEAA